MSPDRLREVARNLFESVKAGDDRTLGEKAIGLLAFQQLGARCEVVPGPGAATRPGRCGSRRGPPPADRCGSAAGPAHVRGTTVFISDLDAERPGADPAQGRRLPAAPARPGVAAGAYTIEVVEGRPASSSRPSSRTGSRSRSPSTTTLWGKVEFAL